MTKGGKAPKLGKNENYSSQNVTQLQALGKGKSGCDSVLNFAPLSMLAKYFSEPIDRAALGLIGVLSAAIAVVVVGHYTCQNNNQCIFANRPRVQNFSWGEADLGAKDRAFIITFDRPMDQREVEKNLVITPALPGKFSWAGRRMAYTLENPIPYGTDYELQITDRKSVV